MLLSWLAELRGWPRSRKSNSFQNQTLEKYCRRSVSSEFYWWFRMLFLWRLGFCRWSSSRSHTSRFQVSSIYRVSFRWWSRWRVESKGWDHCWRTKSCCGFGSKPLKIPNLVSNRFTPIKALIIYKAVFLRSGRVFIENEPLMKSFSYDSFYFRLLTAWLLYGKRKNNVRADIQSLKASLPWNFWLVTVLKMMR